MLNIYTKKYIPKDWVLIYDIELEYGDIVPRHWNELRQDRVVLDFLKKIDKSTVNADGALVTPFSTCAMYDCS